jgi:hypothetical protein
LFLCSETTQSVAMLDEKIDAIWHQFILFTRAYTEFCQDYLGKFIHHLPNTSFTPTTKYAALNFVSNYQNFFGEIPESWNIPSSLKFSTFDDGIRLTGENCGGQDCGGNCDNT